MKTILNCCKAALAFGGMFAIAYLFTFYLDGDIGVVVWSFLLIAPLLSFLLALYARRHLTVRLEAPDYTAKGKVIRIRTIACGSGKLPIPFLCCQLTQSANFLPGDARPIQSAMMAAHPLEFEYELTARHVGCGTVSAAAFSVSDYLGLCRFSLPELPNPVKIGVIPEIPSLSGASVMLHAVTDTVLTQEDEEEESSAAFSSVSVPGYIHREYVPGDNLRRINWKLSAKRSRLMVRMDEAGTAVRPAVILDLCPEETEDALIIRDTMIEGALAFLLLLVRQGIACTLRYSREGQWKCILLESEDTVRSAAVELASADFFCGQHRLDASALSEKAGAYMIYTSRPDAALSENLDAFRNKGYLCLVLPETASADGLKADAIWRLSKDFDMTAVQK